MKAKSRSEREVLIRRGDLDKTWVVFSESESLCRKLTKLFGPGAQKSQVGWQWEIPLASISIRRKRIVSDEQKAKMRQNAKERFTSKPTV